MLLESHAFDYGFSVTVQPHSPFNPAPAEAPLIPSPRNCPIKTQLVASVSEWSSVKDESNNRKEAHHIASVVHLQGGN